jgi:glycosyltransferase involved in cell wall biosynthesis
VHATVLPAKRSDIVKAYPHSLLESLVAGKPVILSDVLPMADFVRQHECGIVIEEVSAQTLVQAIGDLRASYESLAERARLMDPLSFSRNVMIECYRESYRLGGLPTNLKLA